MFARIWIETLYSCSQFSLFSSAADLSTLCTTENKVSSANNWALDVNSSARSFMYIKSSNGASVKPCGTPALTLVHVETCLFKTTLCFLFLKKLLKFKTLSDMSFCFNSKISSCHTLSSTFDISGMTLRTSYSSLNDLYVSCKRHVWLKQESPGLKPDRFWKTRPFLIKTETFH